MTSITWGLTSGCAIIGGMILGAWLSRYLPKGHFTTDSKDTMKIASGMIATLVALVLGLLVASAKNSFDTLNAEAQTMGSKTIYLDHLLAKYGPETKPIRDQIRDSVQAGINRMWPEESGGMTGTQALEAGVGNGERVQELLDQLTPTTDAQRHLLAQAQQLDSEMLQSRWLAIEQEQTTLPTVFFIILLCWLVALFTCIGIFAPHNMTVYVGLILCAVSFSTAIFLIVELSRPLDGLMKISSAPMRKVLEHLDK